MEVILLEDIPSLGTMGDIVRVADGYARNFLLPKKKAIRATSNKLKTLEHEKRLVQDRLDKSIREAERLAKRLEDYSCTIAKPVGESGKLFGAVTSMEIEHNLRENGFNIGRKNILLEEPIKSLGIYTVPVKLNPQVTASLKVWVVKE
ncbi:MAG: 50S ribosomal protein L9 [Deltaproteobacteria bacterium]|nr:50S ribosomal protein L9 [Deltaproteobacteria bacterium]MBW2120601.1 50S ribosomal protein L9 [Deltaproteobacteria bacterium]